eukprot:1869683-Rhodomonas_salina.1
MQTRTPELFAPGTSLPTKPTKTLNPKSRCVGLASGAMLPLAELVSCLPEFNECGPSGIHRREPVRPYPSTVILHPLLSLSGSEHDFTGFAPGVRRSASFPVLQVRACALICEKRSETAKEGGQRLSWKKLKGVACLEGGRRARQDAVSNDGQGANPAVQI